MGTEFSQLITRVTITMQPELDFSRLEVVIKWFCDRWTDDLNFASNDLYEARRCILEVHIKRCLAQARLVRKLKTVEGQATFAALLQGLPRLTALGMETANFIDQEIGAEYFDGFLTEKKPDLSRLSNHQHLKHCDVVPLLLPHLRHVTELALNTDGSIFDRVTSTRIISQCLNDPTGGLTNSAYRLKRISVALTREDACLKSMPVDRTTSEELLRSPHCCRSQSTWKS